MFIPQRFNKKINKYTNKQPYLIIIPKLFSVSKKKFKAGLESLFGDPAVAGMSPFLVDEKEETPKESISKKTKKRSSSKNFTSDLESLFSDIPGNEVPEQLSQTSISKRTTGIKKRTEKPVVGLDALIRKTIEDNKEGMPSVATIRKRITITMEKKKLEQLKEIAKEKKTYLRNIIDDLVSDFLKENRLQDGTA